MNAQVNFLQSGGTWAQVVQSILNSSEFHSTIVPQACGTVIYQDSKHKGIYGWGVGGVIVLPVSDSGTGALGGEYVGQDGNYLQSVIDSAVPGSTILLEQKAVFRLTQPLVLRNLVTLKTVGDPLRFQYANMARLARATNFTGSDTGCGCPPCGEELIRIEPGASLLSVWVDGQRASLSYRGSDINVKILGGIDSTLTTRVANGRISNPAGFSNIQVLGSLEGQRCFGTAVIEENLITSYANDHYFTFLCGGVRRGMFADGVTVSCEKTIVARNDIVDASDVAVVVFSPAADSIQESIVQDNRVLNAGNSAFAAFNTDHIFVDSERDFSGTAFLNNLLWTSDLAHYQIGLSVGSRAWGQAVSGGYGRNATYTGNNTGIKYARGNNAILVAGMRNATVHSNNLSWISVNTSSCPFFVNVVDGTESSPIFNIFTTPNYVNTTVPGGCVAER